MNENQAQSNNQGRRRMLQGIVVSDKMDKTRVVQVKWRSKHSKYQKIGTKANKFKAHDEKNEAKTGDTVLMMETRPISRDKRWVIKEIVQKAAVAAAAGAR
jgi:small subunit ribosomal protein S17